MSNARINQYVSPYDQARIDAAIQKSDSRVVSRAIADKAREESIKATAEYNKSLLDAEKSRMDLEKSRLDAEKSQFDSEKTKINLEKIQTEYNQTIASSELKRLNNEQSNINNKTIALNHEKDILDKERLILSKEVAKLDVEKAKTLQHITKLSVEQSQLEVKKNQIEYNQTIASAEVIRLNNEQSNINKEVVRLNVEKVKTLQNIAKLSVEQLQLEAEKDIIDKERLILSNEVAKLDVEKAKTLQHITKLSVEQSQLEVKKNQIEYNQTIASAEVIRLNNEQSNINKEVVRLDVEKVKTLQNIAKLSVEHLQLKAEIAHNKTVIAQLDLEKAYVTNVHAIAVKAQADALIFVQRSKIMKTLQLLSIHSCKRVDELYFNKSVISITNIYQKTYTNKCASGFGDFIRGCYFVLDFCEMFHFQPNIIINHPLNEFLENSSITNNSSVVEHNISMFEDSNWNKHILNPDNIIINTIRKKDTMTKFVNYLCKLPIDNNNINIYNILFPYFDVSAEHQKVMCDILKPSQEMKEYVVSTLGNFELTENNYIIIHIRSGDNYLNCADKQFNATYLAHITNSVIMLINKHPNSYFLLIADNKFIKLYLSGKQIHRLYIIFNEIGHLGENSQLERNQVKNTMLDFYLFASSSMIYAFSSYDHGTGFSFWCAKTYGIPYSCQIIKH